MHSMPTVSTPLMPQPDKLSGEVAECKSFLLQCSCYFMTQTGMKDQQNIAQFFNLLTRKVLYWVTTMWERGGEPITTYDCFSEL